MDQEKYLENLKQDIYFRIQPSQIHGVGIFAIRDIPKGINPFKIVEPLEWLEFDKKDIEELPSYTKNIVEDFYAFEGDSVYLPKYGLNVFDISHYINHSKTPNMITDDGGETFHTGRDIKSGEELTSDYDLYY